MSSIENPGVISSVAAGANLVARRLVTAAGVYTSGASSVVAGATLYDTDSGQMAAIAINGVVVLESSAAITKGVQVAPAASGKIAAATEGDFIVGVALDAATASGQMVRVRLQ